MKKYLLTLCLTMFAFASSWAQGTGRWSITVDNSPIYVEVNGGNVGAGGNPNVREFTITTPSGASGFTVEAVEVVATGKTAGQYATAGAPVYDSASGKYKVTFTAASTTSVGITHFYIQIKNNEGTIVTTTAATPFEVNVFDMTKARILTNPGDQYITIGQNNIDITLAPVSASATVTATPASGNQGTFTVGSSLTTKDATKNLVTLSVDASAAQLGDKVEITITPPAGSKDRNGNDVQSVTFTLTVAKPELPVTNMLNTYREFRVGEDFPTPLKTETFPADATYTVKYEYLPVAGYNDIITLTNTESQSANLHTNHVGLAKVKATFTPTGSTADRYRTWERILDIKVNKANYKLALSATEQSANTWQPTATPSIEPTQPFTESDYTIRYSLEGALAGSAEVDPTTGVVTIKNFETSQKFNLVATLTPINTNDYEGVTAKTQISVSGTVAGAYLEKQADGSWEAYLATPTQTGSNIVAEFAVRSADPGDTSTPEQLLQQFKEATVIRVSGNINAFNIAQLTHAIGVEETVNYEGALKTLDMSGCQMVGPFTIEGNFPVNGVAVGDDTSRANHHLSLKNVGTFVFPKPDPEYTVLPANFHKFFGNEYNPADNNLTSLSFPEGWTEISDGFSGLSKAVHYTTSAMAHLTTLKLANTITKIGAYAFSDLKVEVLTMPYNIHRIDEYAFSPSAKLQDVYFTGPAPEFVHTYAFAGDTQMCNNTVKDQYLNEKVDPEITRYEFYVGPDNNRVLACILHFPETYRSDYTDTTREYLRRTDGHEYHKGNEDNMYHPEGWTSDVQNNVTNRKDPNPNAPIHNKVNYGAKDAYYGLDMIWPSQEQMVSGFALAQAGYKWSGQLLDPTTQYNTSATYDNGGVDRRGLYQFIIAMNNADINIKFEDGLWYTIALPFNMSVAEIKKVFGEDTQVCRFSKVTRVTEGSEKQIKLEFRKSVMGDINSGDYCGTTYTGIAKDTSEGEQIYEGNDITGILHHFPYMIKPGGTKDNNYVSHTTDADEHTVWSFNGLNFPRLSGTLHPEVIAPSNFTGNKYTFTPILQKTKIKVNSYVLVERKDKPQVTLPNGATAYRHEYAFYKGKKVNGVYEPAGAANQNTAYVQLGVSEGNSDYDIFFKSIDPNKPTTGAKMFSFFGDDEDDAPTAVEKVVIVCGQDQVAGEKIYTINGQLVSGSHLPAGIYIKNGKKYIVK